MDARAQRALRTIRKCIGADRIRLLPHFRQRLAERGLLWADVIGLFEQPTGVRTGGLDNFGRPKWVVAGVAAYGEALEVVCCLDRDETGRLTVFITIYEA